MVAVIISTMLVVISASAASTFFAYCPTNLIGRKLRHLQPEIRLLQFG